MRTLLGDRILAEPVEAPRSASLWTPDVPVEVVRILKCGTRCNPELKPGMICHVKGYLGAVKTEWGMIFSTKDVCAFLP